MSFSSGFASSNSLLDLKLIQHQPIAVGIDEQSVADLQKRYEAFQQETRGRAAKEHHTIHRVQYGDVFAFNREGSALASVVSDEVGVVLGKLKALSVAAKLPLLGDLVEQLYGALERQLVMFYNEMKSSNRNTEEEPHSPGGILSKARGSSFFSSAYFKQSQVSAEQNDEGGSPSSPLMKMGRSSSIVMKRTASGQKPKDNTSVPSSPQHPLPSLSAAPPNVKGTIQPASTPLTTVAASASAQRISLAEGLSASTSLAAESLAVSLRCELVRIYLMDEKKNLKRCAEFPFIGVASDDNTGGNKAGNTSMDMFGGNYTERGLAKSLFSAVCEKGLAISGFDNRPPNNSSNGHGDTTTDGNEASTSNSAQQQSYAIRNCLVWPIVLPSGYMRVIGMVHAINKEGATDEDRKRFTPDDESIIYHMTRQLGIMLERYPSELFHLDVGSLIFKACHPHRLLTPHLPPVIKDVVEGAERVGNEVLRAVAPITIYRGPMATIYKQGAREKKSEDYTPAGGGSLNTITTVEYNLEALNDLWKAGYDENVSMHEQCRLWSTKVKELHLIIKQFVDALVIARGIKDFNEMLMYLRSMELLVRSENAALLVDHINNTMENLKKAPKAPTISFSPKNGEEDDDAAELQSLTSRTVTSANTPRAVNPYQSTKTDIDEVAKKRAKTNEHVNISAIHVDGPTNVRGYTCDPRTKRDQVKAIDDLIERHRLQMAKKNETKTGPEFSQPTVSSTKKAVERPPTPDGEIEDLPMASRRMVYSARKPAAGSHTPLRLHPPVTAHPPSSAKKA